MGAMRKMHEKTEKWLELCKKDHGEFVKDLKKMIPELLVAFPTRSAKKVWKYFIEDELKGLKQEKQHKQKKRNARALRVSKMVQDLVAKNKQASYEPTSFDKKINRLLPGITEE